MSAKAIGSLSAADMLKSCERDDGFCIAYVTAIMDLDERDYLNDEDTQFCLPDRARLADIKGMIVRYLQSTQTSWESHLLRPRLTGSDKVTGVSV